MVKVHIIRVKAKQISKENSTKLSVGNLILEKSENMSFK